MPHNYKSNSTSARDLIAQLDPSNPVQAAHIGELWTLCRNGTRYSNQDGDVMGAAHAALVRGDSEPKDYEQGWVRRWANCPGYIADARRWASASV